MRTEARARLEEKTDAKTKKRIAEQKIAEAEAKKRENEQKAEKRRRRKDHLSDVDLVTDEETAKLLTIAEV